MLFQVSVHKAGAEPSATYPRSAIREIAKCQSLLNLNMKEFYGFGESSKKLSRQTDQANQIDPERNLRSVWGKKTFRKVNKTNQSINQNQSWTGGPKGPKIHERSWLVWQAWFCGSQSGDVVAFVLIKLQGRISGNHYASSHRGLQNKRLCLLTLLVCHSSEFWNKQSSWAAYLPDDLAEE